MLKMLLPVFFTLLLPTLFKNFWALSIMTLMGLSTGMIMVMPAQMSPLSSVSQFLMLDTLSAPLTWLTIWVSALMIAASYKELTNSNKPKMMMLYMTLLCFILSLAFMSHSMMLFYIFFEASLIPTMLLILGWGYQPERLQASMYLILYTVTASLPLLVSILYMHLSNNLSFTLTMWSPTNMSDKLYTAWWLITIMAFLTKMPLYMLHLWLPKAHVEAPVAGSMVLAGILLKLGSYGLIRLSMMMTKMNVLISSPMMSLSLWGAMMSSMVCLRQTDLKALIAYSSIGHMSMLMGGLMSNSSWGWNASLTMMLAHGLCSSSLFALANMTYESTQTRSIFLTKGMMSVFPTMSMWWFLNCAMNMAAPPSTNLLSELFLMMAMVSYSVWTMFTLALLVFLAAAYSLHLYTSSQHGPLPSFTSPMNLYTQRNYSIVFLHLLPGTALIMKPDIIMLWV